MIICWDSALSLECPLLSGSFTGIERMCVTFLLNDGGSLSVLLTALLFLEFFLLRLLFLSSDCMA